ncbi:MAG: hypothetical protein R3Y62_04510, partial [Eubacteriales bacterium]
PNCPKHHGNAYKNQNWSQPVSRRFFMSASHVVPPFHCKSIQNPPSYHRFFRRYPWIFGNYTTKPKKMPSFLEIVAICHCTFAENIVEYKQSKETGGFYHG